VFLVSIDATLLIKPNTRRLLTYTELESTACTSVFSFQRNTTFGTNISDRIDIVNMKTTTDFTKSDKKSRMRSIDEI
jgi:hypothetical protein